MRIPLSERARGTATRDRVYQAIRDAIVCAELEPGRRLSENELAERLGVSRTPVREALARLREERLVAVVPQRGTFVTKIDPDAVADAAFVREALECNAVRLATLNATEDDIAALRANLAAQEEAAERDDAAAFDELDDDLHRIICGLSGRDVAWWLSQRVRGQLDRVRRLSIPEPGYRAEMIAEHHRLIDAIEARDPERAEQVMRHHLQMVLSSMPTLRAEHPDYFEPEEDG